MQARQPMHDVLIELDDAVRPLVHRRDWTDVDTGRVVALVAACDLEMAARVRERTRLHVLDSGPVDADRNFVFGLTSGRTSVATDAARLIYYFRELHRGATLAQEPLVVGSR